MSAPDPRERLELYLLGELSDEECEAVERWLRVHPDGERELKAARQTVEHFDRALARPAGVDDLAERVLERTRPSAPALPWRLLGGGGLLAVAAALVWMLWFGERFEEPAPPPTLVGWRIEASPGSQWTTLSSSELELDHGELALSSEPGASTLRIRSPNGTIEASGTQFLVGSHVRTVTPPASKGSPVFTRLLVLSGMVTLTSTLGSVEAAAGEFAWCDDESSPAKMAATAETGLAFDLYAALAESREGENLCFSPYSITLAFAMLAEGASGPTLTALAELLHLPPEALPVEGEGQRIPAALAQLRTGLVELNRAFAGMPEAKLSIANALWVDQSLPLAPSFQHTVAWDYGAPVHPADFRTHPDAEVRRINAWVEKNTQGRIEELFGDGSFDDLTRVVLANALHFQAAWKEPFAGGTSSGSFVLADGSDVTVPLMHQDDSVHYEKDGDLYSRGLEFLFAALDTGGKRVEGPLPAATPGGFKVLSYPYAGDRLSMVFVLPDGHDGLPELESRLSPASLDAWLEELRPTGVKIWLPKLRIASNIDLGGVLRGMGLEKLFALGGLRNLAEGPEADKLYLSDAIHKTWLDVNETGTEAAAATALRLRALGYAPMFRADHPFLYLIRDDVTGAILFMGRVVDPSAE